MPFLPPAFIELLPQPEPTLTDPAKLAERIEANAKAAAAKLAGRDPGPDARNAQQQALQDIDDLLKLAENPPPPPKGGDGSPPPPMGGNDGDSPPPPPSDGGQPPPPGGGAGKPPPPGGGKPSPGKQPGGGKPMPTGGSPMPGGQQPMPTGPGDQPPPGGPNKGGTDPGDGPAGGSPKPGKPAMPLDDPIAKQVWGHLPDTVRKQMSQYYQEQFMPRYNGLLKDYFSALAEREQQPRPGVSPKR